MHQLLDANWWQKVGPTLAAVFVPTITMFLTYLWLGRRMASYQTLLNKDIEDYKKDLSKEVEDHRAIIITKLDAIKRYSEKQFDLYCALWGALCDLRIAADAMWERANLSNADKFSEQLKKTDDQLTKGSLLIEDGHYEALKKLIWEFSEYRVGKLRLIELRNRRDSRGHFIHDSDIEPFIDEVIAENGHRRQQYQRLLNELESSFKGQIGGRHVRPARRIERQ